MSKCIAIALLSILTFTLFILDSFAEGGCPAGSFPGSGTNECVKLSKRTKLPIDDSMPMVFEAIQESAVIIYVQATGVITQDTPEAFRKFMNTSDGTLVKSINIHSPGGNLNAALELGRLFRKYRLPTYVGRTVPLEGLMVTYDYEEAICASACAYAFLGGITRNYGKNNKFGVHRFGIKNGDLDSSSAQIVSSILARYLEEMGVSQKLLQQASSADFKDEINWISPDEARALRVIFKGTWQTKFSVEEIDGVRGAFFKLSMNGQEYQGSLFCREFPMLIITNTVGNAFDGLRNVRRFKALFHGGSGEELYGYANYADSPDRRPSLIFVIPKLNGKSFSGSGLKFANLFNPEFEKYTQNDMQSGEKLSRYLGWMSLVQRASFDIQAQNGTSTVPIVLKGCQG